MLYFYALKNINLIEHFAYTERTILLNLKLLNLKI